MINSRTIDRDVYKHKDGDLYQILKITPFTLCDNKEINLVEYTPLYTHEVCVRTEKHFESSFKFDHKLDATVVNSKKLIKY